MNKKLFLFILISIALQSCMLVNPNRNYKMPDGPRYTNFNISQIERNQPPQSIKVVTYNIKYSLKINEAIDTFRIHDELKDADIILLQEMDSKGVKEIAEALGYNYTYYPASYHTISQKDFGNAVLTKWKILTDQKIILPHLDKQQLQRIAVGAIIDIAGEKVAAYSTHIDINLNPYNRRRRFNRILSSIPPVKYYIVGGDFNTFTPMDRKAITETYGDKHLQWATKNVGWTFRKWYLLGARVTLDHIFTNGFTTLAADKVFDNAASDHLPVWVDLQFK